MSHFLEIIKIHSDSMNKSKEVRKSTDEVNAVDDIKSQFEDKITEKRDSKPMMKGDIQKIWQEIEEENKDKPETENQKAVHNVLKNLTCLIADKIAPEEDDTPEKEKEKSNIADNLLVSLAQLQLDYAINGNE